MKTKRNAPIAATCNIPHPIRHVRKNGNVVFVMVEHFKRIYKRGAAPPRFRVPCVTHTVES